MFLNKIRLSIQMSLKFALDVPRQNKSSLVQVMALRWTNGKPETNYYSIHWRMFLFSDLNVFDMPVRECKSSLLYNYSYEQIMACQIEKLCQSGEFFIGIWIDICPAHAAHVKQLTWWEGEEIVWSM